MPRRVAKKRKKPTEKIPGKKPIEPLKVREWGTKKAELVAPPARRIGGPVREGKPGPSTFSLGIILRNMIFGKHVKKPGKKKKYVKT